MAALASPFDLAAFRRIGDFYVLRIFQRAR
jgi:hypothetical protein